MAQYAVLLDAPAYKVIDRTPQPDGCVRLKHGEKLGLLYEYRGTKLARKYRVGTVFGYAIECWEDPEAERERNRNNGGDDHWINACGTSLTAEARPQEVLINAAVGMKVMIEGKAYELVAERNNNLGLKPLV